MTDKKALEALVRHQQPAYSYRALRSPGEAGEEGLIDFRLKMWEQEISHTGMAEEIEGLLRSAADHIRLRLMQGSVENE